ncbi:MAG TPA: ABC transporter ATP-binding protein [Kineosporiaceae bacterium]|nr:ABC transporter ATP-binding protein [Kineosporiaceae bacterium]
MTQERPEAGTAVRLRGLRKVFGSGSGEVVAVDRVDLDVADGEFFSMLGPSGSGKTTVLRLVAGFELPTAGTVELGGADVTRRAPFERDVNTVFQDYALFPHLDVLGNVEYGLRVRKVPRAERRERAEQALAAVRLEGFGRRRPGQLSGGQRQRVALARALVNRPRVLLLDEPLGALDLKLREEMQVELKAIQREVGITFVFVTHDQEEALSLSDRVAVFSRGRIEQVGTPQEVYERPATAFVAGFVGTSNLLSPEAVRLLLRSDGQWTVRPERITLLPPDADPPAGAVVAPGTVREVVYAGATTRVMVTLEAGGELVALARGAADVPRRGDAVRLAWHEGDAYRLPAPAPSASEAVATPA